MFTAPILPLSLSPHICVLPSPDLVELLASSSLPPLQHLLQSFSPLTQGTRVQPPSRPLQNVASPPVTTRTTALTTVSHASFPLRFSDLNDIEAACKEDEDERAGRTIDWIGQRIARRAAGWVEHVEREGDMETRDAKTPWWAELQRCTEGDRTPSQFEGWNHPVAVVLAVSTLAPNPLQAVTDLQSRQIDLPTWLDPAMLRHTLIIHPSNSRLNSDEAMALFNATKKQYGLHTHLLSVSLSAPATPMSVPSLLPELPPTPMLDATFTKDARDGAHHLNLTEPDVAQFSRFVREFVTMSLVPWMERCVLDWNETYSSTRRLPSRLFSSTRRLFGGASSTNHTSSASAHASTSYPNVATSAMSGSFSGPPPQQRRLAEFATLLGDLKLAVSVWEWLRKEGRGGSEMLPLLLAPSRALGAHAINALSTLQSQDPAPSTQLRALVYAVRWEKGVRDLAVLGGERWLDMAAGPTEEPPLALLLAHAALISARKGAIRRAAMWYVFAAHRLEKCGIKPLAVYFLRKAHALYRVKPPKNLSPSFEEAVFRKGIDGFDAIMPSIEYSLGRLMYTSGDTEGALRYFLGLLGSTPRHSHQEQEWSETDALYIGDFKVAFEHLRSTMGASALPADLRLPFSFIKAAETKVRLAGQGELDVDDARWDALEEHWSAFWKSRGKEPLEKGGKAVVGERFWVDLMLNNPLDVDMTLTNLTVKVECVNDATNAEVEVIDNVTLQPKESRIVPVSVISHAPGSLKITHLTYTFLCLLPVTETLAVRGSRLHQTAAHRRNVVYGPDIDITVQVAEGGRRLDLSLAARNKSLRQLVLGTGECIDLTLNVRNTGKGNVNVIWIIHSSTLWFDFGDKATHSEHPSGRTEILRSDNSLAKAPPIAVPLASLHTSSVLAPDESVDLRFIVHHENPGPQEVAILLVFQEAEQPIFYSTRLHHMFDVVPILDIGLFARPSANSDISYTVDVEVENVSDTYDVSVSQVTTASANWSCSSIGSQSMANLTNLPPRQTGQVLLQADHWAEGTGSSETKEFVVRQLGVILDGRSVPPSEPPPLDVLFSHVTEAEEPISARSLANAKLLELSKRISTLRLLADQFPNLTARTLPFVFPLRNPQGLDIIVFWEILSEGRRGFVIVRSLLLGAVHAPLDEFIQRSETAKVKRTMYAETTREKGAILEAVRASEWNADMDPIVVRVVSEPCVEHDFSQGHCFVLVTFVIRNFSLSNHTRFILRLQAVDAFQSSEAQHLPPSYTGPLTRRGAVPPLSSVEVKAKMWIVRPGIYGLNGWRLETEVAEHPHEPWRVRASFSQGAVVGEEMIVTLLQRS